MILDTWAKHWGVSHAALNDLRKTLGLLGGTVGTGVGFHSEAGVQSAVRQEASRVGARLWRNNVGATYTPQGAFIRYGLANDSANVNKSMKSADLIGIKPVLITSRHVGFTIGQFVSREVKHPGWRYTATERETAQLNWAELILSMGGDACFVTGTGSL